MYTPHSFDTVSQAIASLRDEGYTEDFILKENRIETHSGEYKISHDEFMVDRFYRFEGITDPGDEAILYAISSDKYRIKGVLVDAYGTYSTPIVNEMMKKLRFRPE